MPVNRHESNKRITLFFCSLFFTTYFCNKSVEKNERHTFLPISPPKPGFFQNFFQIPSLQFIFYSFFDYNFYCNWLMQSFVALYPSFPFSRLFAEIIFNNSMLQKTFSDFGWHDFRAQVTPLILGKIFPDFSDNIPSP